MKKLLVLSLAVMALSMVSCQKEDVNEGANSEDFSFKATAAADYTTASALPVTTVSGDITANTTWDNDHVWEIDGVVVVKNGATLTIEAGTFIKGESTGNPQGVLVISKTGAINAVGTLSSPIVFTSFKLLDNNVGTTASAGDFGGVILLSNGITNSGVNIGIEGLEGGNTDYQFGGTAVPGAEHSNGIMQYVRIEYAGRDLGTGQNSGNEINGLTFGAVGSTTTIDHIQVSYGLDDSFEFFGGTVNPSYLISLAPRDDNFDFDNGYTGTVTYGLVLADVNGEHSTSSGNPDSNGIELDNNASGSSATPITHPTLQFVSIIGTSADGANGSDLYENGIHIRRNGEITLDNVTETGYNTGLRFQSPSVSGNSSWRNISIHGFDNPVLPLGTVLGGGIGNVNTESTANPAISWTLTQPFFNNGTLDFSGSTGAFISGDGWLANWSKFDY